MRTLLDIEGIDSVTASLLEAAGYTDIDALISNKPEVIYAELAKANKMLNIMEQEPSLELVKSWFKSFTEKVEHPSVVVADSQPNSILSTDPSIVEYRVPSALPLAEDFVKNQEIVLAQLPRVTKISDQTGDAEVSLEPSEEKRLPKSLDKKVKAHAIRRVEPRKPEVDKTRLQSIDDYRINGNGVPSHQKQEDTNNVREAMSGTNAGVDPSSEKYIRGVLHNDAQRTYFGAWGQILACILLVGSIAPIVYILFQPEHYIWGWITPVVLFLALVVYALVARKSSCPVCRQRQFVPKACRKHVKAHTWPMLGNMLPTAWHLVRYKWFRCIFCGTSIRLKE
ncbi:DUF4332 domain-containing protein [Rubritalea profundi]|uniref:DUF4332 domain-containing protein n=1 Tax=Rubritalea profundi TaxID=1658618 RepID=A0A2S7TZ23_9BACT|nr:DUF4332 domain-containing protein [Rubritalea profundi]PQJ27374.1 hypothetical protein BSZ32_01920 [Rubritalea profundi]